MLVIGEGKTRKGTRNMATRGRKRMQRFDCKFKDKDECIKNNGHKCPWWRMCWQVG